MLASYLAITNLLRLTIMHYCLAHMKIPYTLWWIMNLDKLRRCSEKFTCVMMSFYFWSKILGSITTVRQRCEHCLRGKNLAKTVLVAFCMVMVVQQISMSIKKLVDIPITTYTHFDFNKTITYPSVTFCREPPYKSDKLLDHGLHSHPRFIPAWLNFNFSSTPLQELWDDITYHEEEFFVQYTLNGRADNLNISSTLGLNSGRCFTLSPRHQVNRATQASGYSVTLQHLGSDAVGTSSYPPGFHVHVHYVREPYTEVEVYNGGLVDYLYVNSGETVDVKLTVDQYIKISKEEDPCTDAFNYSANSCTTKFVWDMVTSLTGCSAPWMTSKIPHCTNYSEMADLISTYIYLYKNHEHTGCPRICRSYLYNAFVTARQSFFKWDSSEKQWLLASSGFGPMYTQVYIHFNSMMVSVYEERYNYDWNLFLSDLGGSVGFLLGLSVIGLMNILTNFWYIIKAATAPESELSSNTNNVKHSATDLTTVKNYKDHKGFSWNNNILNY